MLTALALAPAAQVPSPPAVRVSQLPATKTNQVLTNAISCKRNGDFSLVLRWQLRRGLVSAPVGAQRRALPQKESSKLVTALRKATDLLYVQMDCSGSLGAQINVVFVDRENGHYLAMMLVAGVRSNTLELVPAVEVPFLA